MGELLHCIFGGIPKSVLIMFPTVRLAAVDVNAEEPDWEILVKEVILGRVVLVVRGV